MDFTYYIAGFIALVVGLLAGLLFIAARGRSILRLLGGASAAAFGLDWVLLINWANLGEATATILLFDFLFFAIYSIIGCLIGASPRSLDALPLAQVVAPSRSRLNVR